ncbi:hypothetical protein [Raoultella ornithinolytica]|uniref:hypothetical protein n=1 Tax=Raoultella ornithinolytica TaxID=54291 RepID=UPI0007DAC9EA|nr:hypothetical protein [Raoultella ornithinolytica]
MSREPIIATETTIPASIQAEINRVRASAVRSRQYPEVLHNDAPPFEHEHIKLMEMPGIGGDVLRMIEDTAYRSLPKAAAAATLNLLALVAGLGRVNSIAGGKLNVITFVIAPSAAGKEHPQQFVKLIAGKMHIAHHIIGAPRSDKDMILNLLDADSVQVCNYSVDEAHTFLDSMASKSASQYTQAIEGVMLALSTTDNYVLSGTIRREVKSQYDADLSRAYKSKDAIDKSTAVDREDRLQNVDAKIVKLESAINMVESGIPRPLCNFQMSSTPAKMDGAINEGNIESGLIGRSLVFRCSDDRAELKEIVKTVSLAQLTPIINSLANVMNRHDKETQATEESRAMLDSVRRWAEDNHRRNDPLMGALFARLYERVCSVSSLLAAETGMIQPEHVLYGFSLVMWSMHDIKSMMALSDAENVGESIEIRLMQCVKGVGVPYAALRREVMRTKVLARLDKRDPRIYNDALDRCINDGRLVERDRRVYPS